MITMNEFINNTNSQKTNSFLPTVSKNENIKPIIDKKQDSFEKQEAKKTNKKKILKIGIILTGIIAAALAFLKRKEIGKFFNKMFKKANDVTSPAVENIKSVDTNKKIPIFPTPKFKSNPTIEQRDKYIKEVLDFFYSTPDVDNRLKALKEIEKYGINDLCNIQQNLIGGENETLMQETLRIYQKWGTADNAFNVIEPIAVSQIKITEEKTFVELLKTIQKLARLENESEEAREIIFKPIRRLLNHKNENIRKIAQETLDKITPRK